jgi:predicted MFS family arabinose efflux permease
MSDNLDQQSRFAWLIVFLLFAGSVLNYMDRSLVSVILPQVRRDLAMTNADFGLALNFFLVMYAAFYIVGGRVADRVGYRGAFALTVAFWSLACMAHALVQGLRSLALCRALLGMGEGGFYPAAMRGAAEWFPPESRAKAVGIILSALCVGAFLTPPLVAWITLHYGWRASFLVIGALGLLLLPPWLLLHRRIDRAREAGDPSAVSHRGEEDYAAGHPDAVSVPHPLPLGGEGGPPPAFSSAGAGEPCAVSRPLPLGGEGGSLSAFSSAGAGRVRGSPTRILPAEDDPSLSEVLKTRKYWCVLGARASCDAAWYFYLFWISGYFQDVRRFDLASVGRFLWIPFFCAGVGALTGAWASSALIRRGLGLDRSRKTVLFASLSLCVVGASACFAPAAYLALALVSLALFGHQSFGSNIHTVITEITPPTHVSVLYGITGAAGTLLGAAAQLAIGRVIDLFGYKPAFVWAGGMAVLAAILLLAAGTIERIRRNAAF